MKILVLTGKFGMGHYSAAQTLQHQLEQDGHQVTLVDLFAYMLPDLAPAMYRAFSLMVTYAGGVYNLVHRMTRNMEGDAPAMGQLRHRLAQLIEAEAPDLVLSTHPVCSGWVAQYKAEWDNPLPLVTCITDVTCHSEWIHPGTNAYLAPSATVREGLIAKGVTPSRVIVTGIPVDSRFTCAHHRAGGPRELLIMGGGLGLIPCKNDFFESLDSLPNTHTTILTGRNQRLYQRLAGQYQNIEAVPFTRQVPYYMGRAHLMLSKPGGITTFEAISARLPMLAWAPFLEQERENAYFLVSHGMARIASKDESACLAAIQATLYDDQALEGMRQAMDRLSSGLHKHAICALARSLERKEHCV